jgi:hypothetical protein
MKDHRFIELVNLYIDRQITTAETAELESEIQGNPRRRAVYRQYCQMHRATNLVYDSFRAQANGQAALESTARGTIAQFENRQRGRRHRWVSYAGGLAAAACIAFVLVRNHSQPAPDSSLAQTAKPQPVTVAATVQPTVQPAALANEPVRLKIGPASLRNVSEPDYSALLAAWRQAEQRNAQISSGRTPSLFDDGVFDGQQVMAPAVQRTFRSQQTPAQQAEFTAFQFQR